MRPWFCKKELVRGGGDSFDGNGADSGTLSNDGCDDIGSKKEFRLEVRKKYLISDILFSCREGNSATKNNISDFTCII